MIRWISLIIILAALVTGGYFGVSYIRQQQAAAELRNFQTTTIGRGGLIATVGATGTVRSNQSTLLAWQTSGSVDSVSVEVGDTVLAGEVLATLVNESLAQNVILAQSDLINAQKSLEDLQDSDSARFTAWRAVLQAQQSLIQAERAYDPYELQDFQDDLDAARSDVLDAKEKLDKAKDDLEPYKDFDEDNPTRKSYQGRLDDAQQEYDEVLRELYLLQLEEQNAANERALVQAQLKDAQREFERIKDGPNPNDVAALEARITAAQATLNLAQIQATYPGTISEVQIKPGDQVTPGKVAFRLDDLSRLLVDVRVSEVDINRVAVNQPVILTFDAILGKEYNGLVTKVASVGIASQGVVEFNVTVEVTDADANVRSGMTAAVNIVVEELSNVLLVPNRAVRLLDGSRVVYLLRNGELEPVKISLGASSDQESEVLDGALKTGDVVVLNPPQVFESNGPPPFGGR